MVEGLPIGLTINKRGSGLVDASLYYQTRKKYTYIYPMVVQFASIFRRDWACFEPPNGTRNGTLNEAPN